MRWQLHGGIQRLQFVLGDIGKRIELQSRAIGFDDRNGCTVAALKTFASIYPRIKRLEGPRQWLNLANKAALIRIGEPQIAVLVLSREAFLQWMDGAHILQ